MCEYCENINNNKKLVDTYLNKQKIEINIDKAFNDYILIATIDNKYSTCVKINYCPNCGRKLIDDSNEEKNNRKLVDNNVLITLTVPYERNFRCGCGCNVFSKYIEDDGKEIFVCHGCNEEYSGE